MNIAKMKDNAVYEGQDEMIEAYAESTDNVPELRSEEHFRDFAGYYKYENDLRDIETPKYFE